MADVGDFNFMDPCDCPVVSRGAFPPGIPGGTDVGDFNFDDCSCPLSVLRAFAIDGQTVRVVFDSAPTFRSPGGLNDAMNPANYAFSVDVGDAGSPIATTVSPVLVVGPTRYVGNGGNANERGVDVHVDRPFAEGVTYRVTISNVQTVAGGALGLTHAAAFKGVVLL